MTCECVGQVDFAITKARGNPPVPKYPANIVEMARVVATVHPWEDYTVFWCKTCGAVHTVLGTKRHMTLLPETLTATSEHFSRCVNAETRCLNAEVALKEGLRKAMTVKMVFGSYNMVDDSHVIKALEIVSES